ncbi:MAG: DUF3828 domain-containing protein [Allosphingosinicella sp.]
MILLWLFAAIAPAAAPPGETPRAFVERLYAGYRRSDYSPLARPERVFAPALVAAIREDVRLSRDEVGFMDADPLCECQDPAGLHAGIVSLQQAGAGATVRVAIRFGPAPAPPDNRRALTLRLVRTGAGWRIADLASADQPSLLADLRAFNRQRAKR